DANIVIYLVEQNPVWLSRVTNRLGAIHAAGDELGVSDAARLECLVGPYRSGDATVLADYTAFFQGSNIHILSVTAPVWERAARIRATHGFQALDALHLATAAEHGSGLFLTND